MLDLSDMLDSDVEQNRERRCGVMAPLCDWQAKDLVPTPMSQLEPTLVNNATLAAASSALASVARGRNVSSGGFSDW